ncbi:MAG: hypothetical protein L0I79_05750, partial [Atopostipes sp.]|nr:hypothetical protein [Atopostipes sp.]
PSDFDIALAETIANEKSKFTNDNNQDDRPRKQEQKRNKQFEGCFAELAVAKFLIQVLDEPASNVHVYDGRRQDFNYHINEEFDVKVIRGEQELRCEVRNSWSYKTTLKEFCERYDMIGKYTNATKQFETLADFFIRPVLQLVNFQSAIPTNAIELIKNGQAQLFIVAACTKDEMLQKGKLNPLMTRKNTQYFTTKLNKLSSIDTFEKVYRNLFI